MSVAAAVYVDRQDEIQYPLQFVSEKLDFADERFFFGADAANSRAFHAAVGFMTKSLPTQFVDLNFRVTKPDDIARAQEKCIDYVFQNSTVDFALMLHADVLLSTGCRDRISRLSGEMGSNEARAFPVKHLKLGVVPIHSLWGCNLIGRYSGVKYIGDGAWTDRCEPESDAPWSYEIGYISAEACARKLAAHSRTWGFTDDLSGIFFAGDKERFIESVLRRMRRDENAGLPMFDETDTVIEHIIDRMGIGDELAMCRRIRNKIMGE